MSVVLLGGDPVYATRRGRRFHEGPDCAAMRSAQMIYACGCGDMYCGCRSDHPADAQILSIGDAAIRGMKPCAFCYPGFSEMNVQLPADENFGHQKMYLHQQWHCRKCLARWKEDDGTPGEYPKVWPCTTAHVLGLV